MDDTPEDFDWNDDPETEVCPRCMGDGTINCYCGGDLCVCTNYGDHPCPKCHGEGEVPARQAALEGVR